MGVVPQWIDSHLHIWDPTRMRYRWLADEPPLNRPYGPGDLDTGGHELAGAVVVEAGRDLDEALSEVEWVEQLASGWPVIGAMVAHAPLEWGVEARSRLAALGRHPLVTGVRRNIQDEASGFALAARFVAGVRLLADHGYTFDLCVRHQQLVEVTELVSRVPQVVFVLDHLGKPGVAARLHDPWREDIRRLADYPNVVCKLSGLATEAGPGEWDDGELLPYLRHALREFGPERCMFGGDWPVSTLATTYPRWLELVARATGDLPAAARRAVAADTARRVYRLPAVAG